MTETLLQIGISNLCISLALALVAWTVQSTANRPVLAHLLWLLVLAKLVTPPFLTVPVVAIPAAGAPELFDRGPALVQHSTASLSTAPSVETFLALLWLLGSVSVLAWSLMRVWRFDRLLGMAAEVAPPELQHLASELARRLGLATAPTIHTTSAHVSPMVWWIGGGVRVVIPRALIRDMDAGQLRWILAHELAHIRRHDHLVRWLEWLACICFWWNPVAWWARRGLRANEEICCDALVLQSLKPKPRIYASSLLSAVELLASPALRPPAVASEISGGFLERRLKMIISAEPVRKTPRWLHAFVLICAFALLPLGVAHAQNQDYQAAAARLRTAIEEGGITKAQLEAILQEISARLRVAVAEGELTEVDAKTIMAALKGVAATKEKPEEKGATAGELKKKLEALVRSGQLTDEQARAKLAELTKAARDEQFRKKKQLEEIKSRIAEAVEAGEITEVQALEKLAGYLKSKAVKTKPDQDPELQELKSRIEASVKAGELTKEEAKKKLEAYKARQVKKPGG